MGGADVAVLGSQRLDPDGQRALQAGQRRGRPAQLVEQVADVAEKTAFRATDLSEKLPGFRGAEGDRTLGL